MYTHGITSTVFRQTHVRVGRELARAGITVVAGNNRGSAMATATLQRSGPRLLRGSWFERIEDAAIDLAAWMDVAAASARGLVLLGHSLGATKAALYAAERADPRLAGLVLASPPLRWFDNPPDADLVAQAHRAVESGRPDELLDYPSPIVFGRMSAQTVLSRAAMSDPLPRLREVAYPVLGLYGTNEPDIGGQAELDRMKQQIGDRFTGRLVAGADHTYAGKEPEVAAAIADWISSAVLAAHAPSMP